MKRVKGYNVQTLEILDVAGDKGKAVSFGGCAYPHIEYGFGGAGTFVVGGELSVNVSDL